MKAKVFLMILILIYMSLLIGVAGQPECKAKVSVNIPPSGVSLEGFSIYVNGNFVGETSASGTLKIDLAQGQYSITAKKADGKTCFSGSQNDVSIVSCKPVTVTIPIGPCQQVIPTVPDSPYSPYI